MLRRALRFFVVVGISGFPPLMFLGLPLPGSPTTDRPLTPTTGNFDVWLTAEYRLALNPSQWSYYMSIN
jgi:hypothetical protein